MHQHAHSSTNQRNLGFEVFSHGVGERVRRALVAFYGVEIGTEAAAEAMVVAWQRWPEVEHMENPGGFLFRVGQSKARPHLRWRHGRATFPTSDEVGAWHDESMVELLTALRKVRPEQRAAVLLVKAYGFSYEQAADMLGVSEAALTNHVRRGLARLRWIMEIE
jgi:DNA-directed RNA polymerase specialized sigma24 family protein